MESRATKTVTERQRSTFTKEMTCPVGFACPVCCGNRREFTNNVNDPFKKLTAK